MTRSRLPTSLAILAALWMLLGCGPAALVSRAAAEPMPAVTLNAIVERHCTVCHTDAARNGGLSLQHFDVRDAAPSLVAMMLGKIAGGLSMATIHAAETDLAARRQVMTTMKGGAMLAAGLPPLDDPSTYALVETLADRGQRAHDWSVTTAGVPGMSVAARTVSVLRETRADTPEQSLMFRMVVSCDPSTRQREVQVAWAPAPRSGRLDVTIDTAAAISQVVEGGEEWGNGLGRGEHPAFARLAAFEGAASTRLPARALTISRLFEESVEFSFADLPADARTALAPCF
jgi:hypothetical protein